MALEPHQFETVRDLLAHYSGIYIDRTVQRGLVSGINQRLQATGLQLDAYLAHLAGANGHAEVQNLVETITNHETLFFRNMLHMKAMRNDVLPRLHRSKPPNAPLRIWSAGCSTGEEPYSLAMMALESLGAPLPRPVSIWATDLSNAALARAQQGVYRGRTLSNVQPDVKKRYFDYQKDGWSIRKHVRELVTFDQLNLLAPFPPAIQGVDIIFCQNVTIYFELPTFRRLVERFYEILPEGGLLFLGFSETLWNVFDKFRLQELQGAFAYVKTPPQQPGIPPLAAARAALTVPAERLRRLCPWKPEERPVRPNQARPATGQPGARPGRPPRPLPTTMPAAPASPPPAPPLPRAAPLLQEDAIQRAAELLATGAVDEALALLAQVPLNGAAAPQVLALIARAHANRGDIELAVAEARRAIELDSLTVEAYLLLGMLYGQQGQFAPAARQLERARYLDPESPLISYHLAEIYRQLQQQQGARREYHNTLHKLASYPPDSLLDGVAVGWLRETCERYIRMLG